MDDYGFSATNNANTIILGSEHKVMIYSERGSFRILSRYTDREGSATVTYVRPVLTPEPPQLFLRYVDGVHPNLGFITRQLGGPGAWTGFVLISAVRHGAHLQNYLMEFVCCKYSDQPNAEPYGLELRDRVGGITYASTNRVVRYGKYSRSWEKVTGDNVDIYDSNVPIDMDDFICVSAFPHGVSWMTAGISYCGLTILENGVRCLKMFSGRSGGGYWYAWGTDGCNFCIPVCKFPAPRYAN